MRLPAKELTEWQAYELANGPLGRQYSDDVLAHLYELVHAFMFMMAEINIEDNPVNPPQRFPRPSELYMPQEEDPGMDLEEFGRHAEAEDGLEPRNYGRKRPRTKTFASDRPEEDEPSMSIEEFSALVPESN